MIYVACGLLGAVFGSFAVAQVWRLRARQLVEDKQAGDVVSATEWRQLKPLVGTSLQRDRSRCLQCHHVLAWYDLVPVVSWLSLGGRCRYCRQPIGWVELAVELGLASAFVASVALWPASLADPWQVLLLLLWLLALVLLTILAVYDLHWMLLPDRINLPFIAVAALFGALQISVAADWQLALWSLAGSVLLLAGLYALLYGVSRWRYGEGHTWVGFGDVKLTIGLALLLADWRLAFIALFAANLLGTVLVLPAMLTGRLSRNTRVAFGPLLIAGCLLAWFAGQAIISFYETLLY